jgi:hypothetical protein
MEQNLLSIEQELECQICMDLLTEPTTTVCGHTYCKICLIRYLKTKLNCPMCRKPILQSKENLAKNVILENIIKSKYGKLYEEKLKIARMSYEEESEGGDNLRHNLPAILLEGEYIWPKVKKRLTITNMDLDQTLTISSINDRLLVIMPNDFSITTQEINSNNNRKVCSLVEITAIDKNDSRIIIEVLGLKRFQLSSIRNAVIENNHHPFQVASGEVLKDLEIESVDLLNEVKNKLNEVAEIHNQILHYAPYSLVNKIETIYGKAPGMGTQLNCANLEPISFYYLNLIKNESKKEFYFTNNLMQRVDWLYDKYLIAGHHLDNHSLAMNFYDLNLSGSSHNQLKFTLLLFLCILIFGLGVKFKYLRV